jgi:hypothetical protein
MAVVSPLKVLLDNKMKEFSYYFRPLKGVAGKKRYISYPGKKL